MKQRFHFLRDGSPEAQHPREPFALGPVWMKQTLSPRARAVAGPVLTTEKLYTKIDAKTEKGEGIFVGDRLARRENRKTQDPHATPACGAPLGVRSPDWKARRAG